MLQTLGSAFPLRTHAPGQRPPERAGRTQIGLAEPRRPPAPPLPQPPAASPSRWRSWLGSCGCQTEQLALERQMRAGAGPGARIQSDARWEVCVGASSCKSRHPLRVHSLGSLLKLRCAGSRFSLNTEKYPTEVCKNKETVERVKNQSSGSLGQHCSQQSKSAFRSRGGQPAAPPPHVAWAADP